MLTRLEVLQAESHSAMPEVSKTAKTTTEELRLLKYSKVQPKNI